MNKSREKRSQMSTKSTIISLPCCHIYHDCQGSNGAETLVVSVDYDYIDDQDIIEVDKNSDFAKLIRYLLKDKTKEEIERALK